MSAGTPEPQIIIDKTGFPKLGTYYYHPDQLGSVRMITDQTGAVVYKTEYTAYGEHIPEKTTGTRSTHFTYTSQEEDDTGLMYYGARYYDAETGRFAQADTVIDGAFSTQGWNRYMYVHGNPINVTDPTGNGGWVYDADGGYEYWSDSDKPSSNTNTGGSIYRGPNHKHSASQRRKIAAKNRQKMAARIKQKEQRKEEQKQQEEQRKQQEQKQKEHGGQAGVGTGGNDGGEDNNGQGGGSNTGDSSKSIVIALVAMNPLTKYINIDVIKTFLFGTGEDVNAMTFPWYFTGIGGGVGLAKGISSLPNYAADVLKIIEETGQTIEGYRGGRIFKNFEGTLPNGPLYKEWDVRPFVKGVNRGVERLITGSDGSVYFTKDHYRTFIKIK